MVNVDPIAMDKDESSSASLPSDPSRDESPPSKVEIREESDDEEESSSRHGSEKWMPHVSI